MIFTTAKSLGMNKQSGFTLIELIAVIVILGILSSTAIPRFANLQDEASVATAKGIAASIESASSLNYAIDLAIESGLTNPVDDPFVNIDNCADASSLLLSGTLPEGYTVAASGAIDEHDTRTCILSGLNGSTANFIIIATLGMP